MLTVEGTYSEGKLTLPEEIKFSRPVKVLITFLDDVDLHKEKLSSNFSFKKSRALFNGCNGALSEEIIKERRSEL